MKFSRFTIILPVHNGGRYLRECVESVLNQSYPDFSLAILENKSTDGSAEWCRQLRDPRVQIYESHDYLTIEQNWSRVNTIPLGEFITFIGHDDRLRPNYLSLFERLIKNYPGAALYHTQLCIIDSHGRIIRQAAVRKPIERDNEFLHALIVEDRFSSGTGYLMRTVDYRRVGGIPLYPSLLYADHVLWLRLIQGSFMATTPEVGCEVRIHGENQSMRAGWGAHLDALLRYRAFLESYGKENPRLQSIIQEHLTAHIDRLLCNIYLRALTEASLEGRLLPTTVRDTLEKHRYRNAVPLDTLPRVKRRVFVNRHSVLRAFYGWYRKLRNSK